MTSSNMSRLSGLVGTVAGLYGLLAVFAATVLAGAEFSWSRNALSDLGISSVANIFNYSLILVGILNAVFAVGLIQAYARNTLFKIGGIILVLGGVSLSLVGVLTEDYGVLHMYVSVGYFVLFPIAMIIVGFAFRRNNMQTKGNLAILAGAIALIIILAGIALYRADQLGMGFAVPEYAEALVIAAWTIWMGTSLARGNV